MQDCLESRQIKMVVAQDKLFMVFLHVFGAISFFQMLATSMSVPQSRLQPGVLNISLRVTNGRKTHMKKWKCLSLFIKPGRGESPSKVKFMRHCYAKKRPDIS